MKTFPLFLSAVCALAVSTAPWSRAADAPEPESGKNGYTVVVEMKMSEKGEPEEVSVTKSEDTSPGQVLNKMALAMAAKTKVPPHMKDGVPAKFIVKAPFFFPIEGDEGPEANKLPMPHPKKESVVMPVYPGTLRDGGVAGGAILELEVDATGAITRLSTMRASHPEFQASAEEAVRKWVFAPAMQDGKPVASRTRLAVVYENNEKMADLKYRIPPRPALGAFLVIKPDRPIEDQPAETSAPAADGPAAAPTTPPAEPGK